ncbi:aflatoxin B1 aldehyde reductase member 4-like [Dysidea avara]|uniref:aflatoxin B1 aldehyde reductase member 4-like n=1 Tax=Dysidea avara TaxID=196820 RepID=UPI003325F263
MTSKDGELRTILGTMEFGKVGQKLTTDEACQEVLEAFLAKGYKEIDTALMYGGGECEKFIGRYAPCRDPEKVTLATKINPFHPDGLTRKGVFEQAETSLHSLQVRSVDILYLHLPDHKTPIEETLAAMQELYKQGKFKELGLSNFQSWEVAEIYYLCKENGYVLPTVYQGMYNAVTRRVEDELFLCLRRFNIRFYAYNILAGGLLTGMYNFSVQDDKQRIGRFWGGENDTWMEQVYRSAYWRDSLFKGIEGIKAAVEKAYGGKVSVVNAAIRWAVHHSQLDAKHGDGILFGGSSLKHILSNIDATKEGPLEDDVVKALDEAWELDKTNCAPYYLSDRNKMLNKILPIKKL